MGNPAPTYRVYHLHWGQRAFALLFLALSAFFVIGVWRGVLFNEEKPRPFLMVTTIIFMLVGAGLTVNAFRTTVVFTADAVELRSILGCSRLPLNKIRGRREFVARGDEGGGTRYLVLAPNDDRLPTIQFMRGYTFDEAFFRWFYELPDLDAEDKKVHKDANFGLV
jgi:hypothetical protein